MLKSPGAEPFMNSLLARLETDIAMSTSSLNCLKMEPSIRRRIAETLVPNTKMKVNHALFTFSFDEN